MWDLCGVDVQRADSPASEQIGRSGYCSRNVFDAPALLTEGHAVIQCLIDLDGTISTPTPSSLELLTPQIC